MNIINRNNSPPAEVLLARERNNRDAATKGWGQTLRLKTLREPVAAGLLIFLGAVKASTEAMQMLQNYF